MSKQFKLSQLREINKAYDKFVEIPVSVGETQYKIKLYPNFKPEKIRDLVEELADFYKNADEEKVKVDSPKEDDDIIGYFIFRYFTDIKMTTSKKAKTIYDDYKLLVNSDLYREIGKLIPKESVEKVYRRIDEVLQASAEIQRQFEKAQEQIKNIDLQNKDILFGKENNVQQ